MNIDDLTLGQLKEVLAFAPALAGQAAQTSEHGLSSMIGQKVIIRTYSAGCWFGTLSEKSGSEVVITEARRMWRWKAAEGISLSGCALHGVCHSSSKIVEPVSKQWLDAIEITPCTEKAILSLEGAPNVQAQ